jgi:hypothetical protein
MGKAHKYPPRLGGPLQRGYLLLLKYLVYKKFFISCAPPCEKGGYSFRHNAGVKSPPRQGLIPGGPFLKYGGAINPRGF